jgi:hypothetical protein
MISQFVATNHTMQATHTAYYPTDLPEVLRTLDYIRRYGDREAFRKPGELYQWLSQDSSKLSAPS